jgi:bifunctional non-homologous end joining protein LigD
MVGPTLDEYAAKRDFAKTPEPAGGAPAASTGPLTFAVQKHDASRLHYDLRLELDGVLKSWAVPNGPSLDPEEKRLAVMTEDHPLLYTQFEGVIPRGEYGAGEMIVWDRGSYAPEKGVAASRAEQEALVRQGIERGRLTILLNGQKLHGLFSLVRTSRSPKEWLLIKKQDAFAATGRDVTADGRSALSGLTIEELKAGRRPSPHAGLPFAERLAAAPGAREAPFPREVEPMAATLAEHAFSNAKWLFEPKMDGYRVVAFVRGGTVKLQSRRGLDSTNEYPCLLDELASQPRDLVVDGEVVALDENGRPSFDVLKTRLSEIKRSRLSGGLLYYAFDLLWCDGFDLRGVPLHHRKALLKEALAQTPNVRMVEHVDEDGGSFYEAVRQLGLEGMVAKHRDSLYEPRRSPHWLKIKTTTGDEFVIGGFTRGEGNRADTFGALLLGQYDAAGKLVYMGSAGTGFDDRTTAAIRKRLDPLVCDASPFANEVNTNRNRPAVWVRPELVAEATYVEITKDDRLRAPVFVRLRPDKSPAEARRADTVAPPPSDARPAVLAQLENPARGFVLEVEGQQLSLTNLEREYWPGLTKRDLLRYLVRASPYLLPHLKERPLTLIRYPEGIDGERFYQKHWPKGKPEFVDDVVVYSDHNVGDEQLLIVNNLAALLWTGQMGALELHSWYSRTVAEPDGARGHAQFSGSIENMKGSRLNYPDYVVFDLDPVRPEGQSEPRFEREKFKRVCDVAHWLRELLDTLSVSSFVKTTGRSGLHVYVPIRRQLDFDATRAISQTVAQFLKTQHPAEIALEFAVRKRVGEVFVDTNQNVRGKTLASIYSPRATATATVSTPLRWDEVGKATPADFTVLTLPDRLDALGDLWGDVYEAKADMAGALGAAAA